VVVKYKHGTSPALKGLSFVIEPGQKVGICGRSGSGKSTLLASLFRLVPAETGEIEIDSLNIADIGLTDLRKKLSIIPQDPVMFIGTIRYNIDPFDQFTDEECWSTLGIVGLKDKVEHVPALSVTWFDY